MTTKERKKRFTEGLRLVMTQCASCQNDIFIKGKSRCAEYGKHPNEYLLNEKDCPRWVSSK